jgi:HEAT repeat protein
VEAASHDDSAAALDALARAALDLDPWVRRTAIRALSQRTADPLQRREAARSLLAPLASADDATRELAAIAAGDLGARELVEPLGRLAGDPNVRVAFQALTSLERLGDAAALTRVAAALDASDQGLRHRALLTLGSLAAASATGSFPDDGGRARLMALDTAARATAHVAKDVTAPMVLRQHAMVTLGRVPAHAARQTLEALAQDEDARIAAQARLVLDGQTAGSAVGSQGGDRQ